MVRACALGMLCGLLVGCSSVYIGAGYSNYYDPWYWGPDHYHTTVIVPPAGPGQGLPSKPDRPIGRPPAKPTPLPARPPPRPQSRPAARPGRR